MRDRHTDPVRCPTCADRRPNAGCVRRLRSLSAPVHDSGDKVTLTLYRLRDGSCRTRCYTVDGDEGVTGVHKFVSFGRQNFTALTIYCPSFSFGHYHVGFTLEHMQLCRFWKRVSLFHYIFFKALF